MHDPDPPRGRECPYKCLCGLRFATMHDLRLHNGLLKTWNDEHWPVLPPNDLASCAARHKLVL